MPLKWMRGCLESRCAGCLADRRVTTCTVLAALEGSAVFQERFHCQFGQLWLAVAGSVGWVVTYIAAGYADAALAPSEHWIAHTMSLEERSQPGP